MNYLKSTWGGQEMGVQVKILDTHKSSNLSLIPKRVKVEGQGIYFTSFSLIYTHKHVHPLLIDHAHNNDLFS